MIVSRTRTVVVSAAAAATALSVAAAPASAHRPSGPLTPLREGRTLSDAYVGPLQFAVAGRSVYVADSFAGTLTRLGNPTPIATAPPGDQSDLSGVAVSPDRRMIAYGSTTRVGAGSDQEAQVVGATLTVLRRGQAPVVADLWAFEKAHNPDGASHYGVANADQCVRDALGPGADYTGGVDSHPYAVAYLGHGDWAVADAGGNDILKVDRHGTVSLLAVLPPQPTTVTQAMADAENLPDCVVGQTYAFEPVPTDVEVARHGTLLVSTLPGGPESADFGSRGSVYAVNPWTHATRRLATGFGGATNLAVDQHGRIYVAELFAGRISAVVDGAPHPVLTLDAAAAVEYAHGMLFASTAPAVNGAQAPGRILTLVRVRHRH